MINQEELSKKTPHALKKQLSYLEKVLAKQKAKPIVRKMLDFESLPQDEQWQIMSEWNDYYKKVKTTKVYRRFCLLKEAYKRGDFARVKEIVAIDRRAREEGRSPELVKPKGFDYETDHNSPEFLSYLGVKKDIEAIKEELKLRKEEDDLLL